MNKSVAHIILLLVDAAALFACYYVCSEYENVIREINTFTDSIILQKPLGLYSVLIMVPVLHGVSLLSITEEKSKLLNRSVVIFFLILVVSAFVFDAWLENKIINSGYYYCNEGSESMRMSEFRLYLREGQECIN